MGHKDVLKLLFPMELNGIFESDTAIEGEALDGVQSRSDDLQREVFPDQTNEFLTNWERVYSIVPGVNDTEQIRRDRILREMRKIGGLSKTYFRQLAESMGYTITITDNIEEYLPFMTGWGRTADRLYKYEVIWIWRVHVDSKPIYYFTAGDSVAGEELLWWDPESDFESVFSGLKPAHTYVLFEYS